jgi:hypothetical protein
MKAFVIVMSAALLAVAATSADATLVVKDQSDAENTMTGTWYDQAETYESEVWLNDNSKWAYGDGSVFTWNFSSLVNDVYYVYASWKNSGDGSAAAVYSGLDGGDVTINQKVPPTAATYNDVPFGYLGQVTISGGAAAISLTSPSGYPYAYADAIALDTENPPPAPKTFIVNDQEDPGNTMSGDWYYQPVSNPSKELWVNDDSRWAYGGASVFSWNFSDLSNGVYEVYASWANSGDGSSQAVYSGLDGGDVTINQTIAPDSEDIGGIPFGYLGKVTVSNGTTSISLSSAANYPYADAIALLVPEPSMLMLLALGVFVVAPAILHRRAR